MYEASTNDLEWSLRRSQEDILTHWNEHTSRLGRRYEEGDAIARDQMKDIIIQLQRALLAHLRDNNAQLDIMALLYASDQGRNETIAVLIGLYQRISQTSFVPYPMSTGPVVVDRSSNLARELDRIERRGISDIPYTHRVMAVPSSPGDHRNSGRWTSSPPEPSGLFPQLEGSSPSTSTSRRSSRSSSFTTFFRRRSSAEQSIFSEPAVNSRYSSLGSANMSPPSRRSYSIAHAPEPASDCHDRIPEIHAPDLVDPERGYTTRLHEPILEDQQEHDSARDSSDDIMREVTNNPWNMDPHSKALEAAHRRSPSPSHPTSRTRASRTTPTRHPSLPPQRPPPLEARNAPSRASTSSSASLSTPSSSVHKPSASSPSPHPSYWPPSKDTNYSGFCKGAWKLHSGLGGFKVHSVPSGYYNLETKWRCDSCFFEMPHVPGQSRTDHRFDTKVYLHRGSAIQFRWLFLAKSHLKVRRAYVGVSKEARGPFGCIFCCAEKNEPVPAFGTLDVFMDHLGACHRLIGDVALLDRTRCVVGRIAGSDEEFDVNIPPEKW
ncbi:hypothetical protein N7462_001276 [Penicillium macrosclerotiorum]|uniref:uncharacterized protein n=1 Tax=Penicillium macrosclerotiorum TaxID=303699 RepID=UPI002548E7BD|nr:uncharacterized protein N7462_001276 [Penicillium macrosclerotiorum]KAJ5691853.1 hypothetical protein N7462_001276 [Penicillium macrosclerotiorum]